MKCGVEYCIYNRAFECICNNVQLKSFGMCEECILVSLVENLLETNKENQLRKIRERWRKDIGKKTGNRGSK